MKDWTNQKVLIIGAARQGLAAARYLAKKGAQVTLNDQKNAEQLGPLMQTMSEISIRWELGHHDDRLLEGIDLVCVSGGVPLDLPLIKAAVSKGIQLSNDSQLLMEVVPCKVIGITGSAGKTTTTTLAGRIAQAGIKSPARVWVGGNIGKPLIDLAEEMHSQDLVIIEFSSFQLELMTLSPHIGAVLNITPNHLDRHGTMEAYTAAKANIISHQNTHDKAILGRDNPGAWSFSKKIVGNVISFGFSPVPEGGVGILIENERIQLQDGKERIEIMPVDCIELRGKHNQQNVMAACAVCYAAGIPLESMVRGVEGFRGVPHRLEPVRTWHGATWYNDSKATTPDGVMASVQSFTEPMVLMVGGKDKHLPWDELITLIRQRVDHLIVFGNAAPIILEALDRNPGSSHLLSVQRCEGVYDAVQAAARVVKPGDVVLLSPGGTSYDEFNNFEERGERYKEWVNQLL